eukprot:5037772-Prymnesium_polylepis.1
MEQVGTCEERNKGTIVRFLSRISGLPPPHIWRFFVDRSNLLTLALHHLVHELLMNASMSSPRGKFALARQRDRRRDRCLPRVRVGARPPLHRRLLLFTYLGLRIAMPQSRTISFHSFARFARFARSLVRSEAHSLARRLI